MAQLPMPKTKLTATPGKLPGLLESGGPGEKSAFGKHLYTVDESSSLPDSPVASKERLNDRNQMQMQLVKELPGAPLPPPKPCGSDTPSSVMTFQGHQPNKFGLPYKMPRKLTHIKDVGADEDM